MGNRIIKVGADIGNSAVKGCVLNAQNGFLRDILMPSSVTYIHDVRHLNYPEKDTCYVQVTNSPLEHSGMIAAIGARAMEIPNYQQYDVSSTSYKTGHELTAALLFGIIGETVQPEEKEIDIILAVSVPIVESKTYSLVDDYKASLAGTHEIRIYRESGMQDVKVNVLIAQVLNEGQSGFLGLLDMADSKFLSSMNQLYKTLGEQSNPITTLEDFAIVDIGEGTTDIAVFRKKRFNPEYSYSVTKGYGTVLEQAMADAEREGLTIESRKQLQELLETTNTRRQERKALWRKFVDVQLHAYADEVVATVLKTFGRQSYLDAIIFLGGGFSAVTGYALDAEGKAVMSDPYLFDLLHETLGKNNKTADLIFGVPQPYAQTINGRGLMQVLTSQNVK